MIGMLSSRVDDLHELQWLGAADAAAAHGVDLVTFVGAEVACPDGYRSRANAIYDLAGADRLDGLIVWTTALEMFIGSRAMDEFCRRFDPLPIVSVERVLAGSPSVLMDERLGMDDAVSHLIEAHGCERIAFIRGPANHTGAEHRYQGYRDALARHGLRSDPALAPAVREWAPEPAAVAATKLLTNRSAPVDAFATANDDLALGVLGALDAQHLRVPYDVAVVGFDDHTDLTHHGVGLDVMMLSNLGAERAMSLTAALLPLTTVRAPFYELGRRAVELLLDRLSGVAVPDIVTIPTKLVVRRSCGCFSSAVRDVVNRRVDRERFSDTGWEQVANEMRHALPRSNASLPTDWPERLEAAFVKDVETESAAAFLELLDELMRASIAAGDTLDKWPRALSALRRHTASAHALADTSPAVEDFWLRVHSLVRELAARLTDYEHIDTARRDRIVRGAGRRLNAAHDAEELTEVLVGELPELGIPSCYLAMYGSEGELEEAERQGDARTWSRSLLVYEAGRVRKLRAGRRSFRSRELAPTTRLGTATPSTMVAIPLYFQERQLGFALFEVGPRLGWVYGDLQEQLSSALHSALLIEREHRALAAVEQAHSELEQRVALRTAELATANEALARLADEQAALRRVATLVAQEAPQAEVFGAIAEEIGGLLGAEEVRMLRFNSDGSAVVVGGFGRPDAFPLGSRLHLEGDSVALRVRRTQQPARFDDYRVAAGPDAETARSIGVRAVVGVPVFVEGRLWGAISAGSTHDKPLPADTESRLDKFTKLMATAIANAEARAEVHRLADEQAALRQVAVLVAQQPSPSEVFTAVTQAVGLVLGADLAGLNVFEGDATTTIAGWSGDGGPIPPIGSRFALHGDSVVARIFETGAPARIDSYAEAQGEAADVARSLRLRSTVGAPILVEGKLWGALVAGTRGLEPWAENAETRIAAFTELVATAIANAESREALAKLADEQVALRRVATMVAQGASPQDLFDAVAEEVGRLLLAANVSMGRYEPDDSVTSMASWSSAGPVFTPGVRWQIKGTNVAWMVLQTGRPARIDDYSAATDPIGVAVREAGYKSAVGSPIVVEGHLWGVISAASTEGPMPPGAEARLASFTELVATAIANAESSAELAASRRRIVAASDEARRRIERDLHDGVQQRLVSLGLRLGLVEAALPPDPDLSAQVGQIAGDVTGVLEELVEISRGIHPAIRSHGGLEPALMTLARRSALPVELEVEIDGALSEEVEVAAYYVVSEALANVAKHAAATSARVGAAREGGVLRISVRDNGVGGADPTRGTGLIGLADRVDALGGTIKVDSVEGQGTCVAVTLPIARELDQEVENLLVPPQSL